jgi:protein disulfide-isomerase A1
MISRFSSLVFLSFVLFVSLSFAHDHHEDHGDDDVVVLNNENFEGFLSAHPLSLVEFYAPWCGHCKKLAPLYAAAASELKGIVPLAKIDADSENNRPLAQRFGVRGFPTLLVFRNGLPSEYQGERTKEGLISYMLKQNSPALTNLQTLEEAIQFSSKDKVVVIGFFHSETSEGSLF